MARCVSAADGHKRGYAMKRAAPLFGIALFTIFASACHPAPSAGPPAQPAAVSNASLLGTWELVSVDGIVLRPKSVSVTFDRGGAFKAMVDCNRARGTYVYDGAELSFRGWEITEMGCVPALPQEALIGEALRGDDYAVTVTSSSDLHLSGRHRLVLRRL